MSAETLENEALEAYRVAIEAQLENDRLTLPFLPRVVHEVLAMAIKPEVNVAELSALVHRDQALAGHVLRIANSAAYRGARPIVSLTQAVTRLGGQLLAEIAVSVSLQGAVFRVPGYEKDVRALWHHALVSGLYGKEVARIKRKNVEGQFLCGLLHTIGKPVVLQVVNELKPALKQPIDAAQLAELVEAYHGPIGSRLADLWKLPEQVRTAIAWYRHYEAAPNHHESTQMTYLVHRLADWLLDPAAEKQTAITDDPILQTLNLYSDDVERLFNEAEQVRSVLAAIQF